MQVAVALGTLLLGGWVLTSPGEEQPVLEEQQPGLMNQVLPSPGQQRPGTRTEGQGQTAPGGTEGNGTPAPSTQAPMLTPMQQLRRTTMPLAPTDAVPPGAETMLGQPASPTSGGPLGTASGTGARMASGGGTRMAPGSGGGTSLSAPTQQRGSFAPESPYSFMVPNTSGQSRNPARANDSAALALPQVAAPAAQKAFAGYRAQSGVSPYMNLFRTGNALGTIDNYTTLVRPQLEQRYLNQQMGSQIGNVERNSRIQQMRLQQLNQQEQNRALQGVGTPQFYMNYQNYYPGMGQ